MTFAEYLWALLSRPYKDSGGDTDLRRWVTTYGVSLDELKDAIFRLRRAWLVATAAGGTLDLLGAERGLPRLGGESDEYYRQRVQAAYWTYAWGGTLRGMQEMLRTMGFPAAWVHECFRDGSAIPHRNGQYSYNGAVAHRGGVRWAEFKVYPDVPTNRTFRYADALALRDAVMRTKPAHTRLAAIVILATMTDYLAMQDVVATSLRFADHPTGMAMVDDARLRVSARWAIADRMGGHRYSGDRHRDGGPRWLHSGSLLRVPRIRYDGQRTHSGTFRRSESVAHYGDRRFLHNGMLRYRRFPAHDSRLHRDEGMADMVDITIRRHDVPVERLT